METTHTETKQVIVIRKDLNMSPGKLAAQVAHASLGCILQKMELSETGNGSGWRRTLNTGCGDETEEWLNGSYRKIILYVKSLESLMKYYNKAKDAGLNVRLITDKGTTEFNGVPTTTCFGIGPDWDENIDAITSKLQLLQ